MSLAHRDRIGVPAFRQTLRDVVIRDREVERRSAEMALDALHMVLHAVRIRLAVLRRHVAHEDPHRLRLQERHAELWYQQVRQHTRIETTRPHHDQVRVANRVDRVRVCGRKLRLQCDLIDLRVCGRDRRFPPDRLAGLRSRDQPHVLQGRWQDLPAHRQDPPRLVDRLLHRARHRRHRHDEEVAERVPRQPRPRILRETVLKQPCHQRFGVGHGGDAVAHVARRDHPQVASQLPRRAPVIRDGHHRRQVVRVLLEPAQQDREARAPADRDDPRSPPCEAVLVDQIDQALRLAGVVRARPPIADRSQQGGVELPHPHDHE